MWLYGGFIWLKCIVQNLVKWGYDFMSFCTILIIYICASFSYVNLIIIVKYCIIIGKDERR